MAREARRSRRRRPAAEEGGARHAAVPQLPWRVVDNPHPPLEPLSADQVETIHLASLNVLENLGMEVMGDDTLDLFQKAGADVDRSTGMVRLDRGLVEQALSTAPSEFTLTPRNPAHAIKIGGNRVNFGFVSGAPNVHDRINGRRGGNLEDFKTLMKFAQYFNCVHFMGNQVAPPIEMPPNNRHLDTGKVQLTYTDKIISGIPIGAGRVCATTSPWLRSPAARAWKTLNGTEVASPTSISTRPASWTWKWRTARWNWRGTTRPPSSRPSP